MATSSNPLPKWPKRFPPLTEDQQRISDDFMRHWHTVLPKRYGIVEKFNHGYVAHRRDLLSEEATTLEIGAGIGEHYEWEKKSGKYVAIDIRPNMLEELQKKFPQVETYCLDCQKNMPFAAGSFDRVVAVHVLEHLCDLPEAVREVRRIIRHDGQFCLVIPCEGSFAYGIARKISAQRIFEKRYQQSYQWFIEREHVNRPKEIIEELERYFKIVDRTYFPLPFLPCESLNLCIGLTCIPNER